MKTLFIEAKLKTQDTGDISLPKAEISKLPKELFLVYTIQYKELAYNIDKQLQKEKIKVEKVQQILGCSKINTKLPILYIGTGRFHIINLYTQTPIIYTLNPEDKKIIQIPDSEIQDIKKKRKTALIKFLKADTIGILVSTKPGQENMDKAGSLKKKLEKQGKSAYIFVSNNIDINQFENFSIDSWVNTACPGLAMDNSSIINIDELPN